MLDHSIQVCGHIYNISVDENGSAQKNEDEDLFWKNTIDKHLKPDTSNASQEVESSASSEGGQTNTRKSVEEELTDLRNYSSVFVFLLNAILVTILRSHICECF